MIPKVNKPELLIYDIEPAFDIIEYENDDNNRRYLSELKMYYNEPGIKDIFIRVDCKEPVKMISQLYRYNSEAFAILRDYLRRGEINYSFYWPTHRDYVASEKKGESSQSVSDFLKLEYFEQLIEETHSDGVKLIVVASPKFGASSTQELLPVIELCNKHGVPFWDYYLEMHDTKWFCDNMHLNFEGSQKFTKIIIQRIKDEKLLK